MEKKGGKKTIERKYWSKQNTMYHKHGAVMAISEGYIV